MSDSRNDAMCQAAKQVPPTPSQEAFGCDFSKSLKQIEIDNILRQELSKQDTSDWKDWQFKSWVMRKRVEYGYK